MKLLYVALYAACKPRYGASRLGVCLLCCAYPSSCFYLVDLQHAQQGKLELVVCRSKTPVQAVTARQLMMQHTPRQVLPTLSKLFLTTTNRRVTMR